MITDIADEEDTESICENLLFNGHEATLHGLLTLGMLRDFFQLVMVIYLKQSKMRLHQSWDYLRLLFSIAPTLLGVNDNLLISAVSFVGVEELVTERDH